MMKVYSVLRSEPYQGYDLLVVFGSRQECLDYIERQTGYIEGWHDFGVVESELGQEIDFFDMVDWINHT
jgi:hypothetical protein